MLTVRRAIHEMQVPDPKTVPRCAANEPCQVGLHMRNLPHTSA